MFSPTVPAGAVFRRGGMLVLLWILSGFPLPAQVPRGATLRLFTSEVDEWVLPATVELEVTGPPSAGFLGSNLRTGRTETGSPLFSQAPRLNGATFYRCDIVWGFPNTTVGSRPFPGGRLGNSSFIAVKTEPDGTRKTWINATVGGVRFSGAITFNWEYQIRYFSGDPVNRIPESMTIGIVPNSGSFGGRAVTFYDVDVHTAEIRVKEVDSQYAGRPHFLEGVPFPVIWRAKMDWAGTAPGKVLFMTSKSTNEVQALGEFAYHKIDMGSEFVPGADLRVAPLLPGGIPGEEKKAPMEMMSSPVGWLRFLLPELATGTTETRGGGSNTLSFTYSTGGGLIATLLDFKLPADVIPKWVPIFGTNGFEADCVPDLAYSVSSDGKAELSLAWSGLGERLGFKNLAGEKNSPKPKTIARLLGQYSHNPEFVKSSLSRLKSAQRNFYLVPSISGSRKYNDDADRWEKERFSLAIAAGYSASFSRPFITPTGVPMYWKLAGSLEGKAGATVGISPWNIDFPVNATLSVRGSLGIGIDELLAAEGWIQGALESGWIFNTNKSSEAPEKLLIHLSGGVTAQALVFKWEQELKRITWDLHNPAPPPSELFQPASVPRPVPLSRAYLLHPDASRFHGGNLRLAGPNRAPAALVPAAAPLQSSVFPLAQPAVGANDREAHLIWLQDDPARSDFNRTRLVSSRFDGTRWTAPEPVADDGTADFHPQIQVFANGDALAAWSNQRLAHAGAATYETMLASMDVAVARYDGTAHRWLPAVPFKAGNHLNLAPKISGKNAADCLLVWLSNPASDPGGGVTKPNEIWSARLLSGVWSNPVRLAILPNPVLRLALLFDGTRGQLVCSVDQDADPATLADRELHRATWEAGQWSPLTRLTRDEVPDDNPALVADAAGKPILVWLRDGELSVAPDADPTRRQSILKTEYSSNLADFRVASGPGGRAAVLWAEPSKNGSDLWSIQLDPSAGVWGEPKQLTDDPETERGITTTYFGADTLLAVYNRSLIGPAPAGAAPLDVRPGPVSDLFVMTYQPGMDVGIDPESLDFAPDRPRAGDEIETSVMVQNLGDRAVTDLQVALIRNGNSEVARTNLTGVFRPGESRPVKFLWTVSDPLPADLLIVADPDQKTGDARLTNNQVRIPITVSDLKLQSLTWTQSPTNAQRLSFEAWVVNTGTQPSGVGRLLIRSSTAGGPVYATNGVPPLAAGQSGFVGLTLDLPNLSTLEGLIVVVESPSGVQDVDPANNQVLLTLNAKDPAVPAELRAIRVADGSLEIRVSGSNGTVYQVEVSEDLLNWRPWKSATPAASPVALNDPQAASTPQRFFRAVAPE